MAKMVEKIFNIDYRKNSSYIVCPIAILISNRFSTAYIAL